MSPDLKSCLDEFKSFQMEERPAIEVKVHIIFIILWFKYFRNKMIMLDEIF